MSRIDTINLYKDFVKSGFTEDQALANIRGLDEVTNGFVTNVEFHNEMNGVKKEISQLKNINYVIMGIVILPLITQLVSPIINRILPILGH